jgi:hydrophobic/amphiphilic exporter-1 (mainly G- bacteria), HAE1 family
VRFHLLFGGALAVFVVFFFLRNFRSTLISAVAIPTSIIGTFVFISGLGFSLNIMTMLALSLSVGILIDDAIVVLENIYRHMEEGMGRYQSAEFGTSEIGLAVMATTFSIVAVFVPVAFIEGIIGRFFYSFGMTVAAAVLISLFVSFTLTPMLSSRFLRIPPRHGRAFRAIERLLAGVDRGYRGLLGSSLRHRPVVVGIAVAAFLLSLFMVRFVGFEFMPQPDEGEFTVVVKAEPGTSLEATDRIVQEVEARLRKDPLVTRLFTTVGGGTQDKVSEATIQTKVVAAAERSLSQDALVALKRQELADIEGARISVTARPAHGRRRHPLRDCCR